MNTRNHLLLPLALTLGAAGLSFANDPGLPAHGADALQYSSPPAEETRSQVQGPVAGAEAAGLIERGEATAPEVERPLGHSYLSRAYVQAEAAEAYRMGLVAHGETYPEPTPAQVQQMQLAAERAVMDTQLARADDPAMRPYQ